MDLYHCYMGKVLLIFDCKFRRYIYPAKEVRFLFQDKAIYPYLAYHRTKQLQEASSNAISYTGLMAIEYRYNSNHKSIVFANKLHRIDGITKISYNPKLLLQT